MKFNNPVVVFDLETTDCDEHAIIEVGAVVLTRELHRVIGSFQTLVKPDFPVSDFVVELTGIGREELDAAPDWISAATAFEQWVEETAGCSINKVRLAAWGNYFDVSVIRKQYARHGIAYPFSGTVIDVKTAALMWCAMSGRRTDSLSVSSCAKHMGIEPEGTYHRARTDAVATAEIFRRVVGDMAGGVWVDKKYIRVGAE